MARREAIMKMHHNPNKASENKSAPKEIEETRPEVAERGEGPEGIAVSRPEGPGDDSAEATTDLRRSARVASQAAEGRRSSLKGSREELILDFERAAVCPW